MKKALLVIATLALAASTISMVIEAEEGKKEREAKTPQIESLFDFDIVSETIRSLKRGASTGLCWIPQNWLTDGHLT